MSEGALFLKFWEKEGAATRKVLSRIPEGSDYRPDPKSRPAREIAWLIVREEIALGEGLRKGQLEWTEVPAPKTMKEVMDEYDRQHDKITAEFRATRRGGVAEESAVHPWRPDRDERDRLRQRVRIPLRHRPPPRPDLHVPAGHGIDRAADLRPERRRTDVTVAWGFRLGAEARGFRLQAWGVRLGAWEVGALKPEA